MLSLGVSSCSNAVYRIIDTTILMLNQRRIPEAQSVRLQIEAGRSSYTCPWVMAVPLAEYTDGWSKDAAPEITNQ